MKRSGNDQSMCEIGRGYMWSAFLAFFAEFFDFHAWRTDFTSNRVPQIVLHDCLKIENCRKKKKSLGLNSHDISKHNYKAFNSLCHADRSTRWHHTQVRCLAQAKKKKKHNKTPVPDSSVHSVKRASTQNRLARSPRSCFTTLQLYTSAVSEHKTHYRAAGRVDRQQSVSAGQTHTGAVITNF